MEINKNQPVETIRQEASRRGISLSEVRRQRNDATPRKETLRLMDGMSYVDGFGDVVKVRLLKPTEHRTFIIGNKHTFICVETHRSYTECGIYDKVTGPLEKFNLIEKVA